MVMEGAAVTQEKAYIGPLARLPSVSRQLHLLAVVLMQLLFVLSALSPSDRSDFASVALQIAGSIV